MRLEQLGAAKNLIPNGSNAGRVSAVELGEGTEAV